MKIDIMGDTHFDFWLRETKGFSRNKYDFYFKELLSCSGSETLIIAGDIGHNNTQNINVLKHIRDSYYKNIVMVFGNHDYYLISKKQKAKYETSENKLVEMKELIDHEHGLYLLDGDLIEIDGIKFGGAAVMYDGSLHPELSKQDLQILWLEGISDANYTFPQRRYDDIFKAELPKLERVYKECDVMITHTAPISDIRIFEEMYPSEPKYERELRGFYCFDGEKYLKETTAKTWIFGHTHKNFESIEQGVRVICNSLGYPKKNATMKKHPFKLITIEV